MALLLLRVHTCVISLCIAVKQALLVLELIAILAIQGMLTRSANGSFASCHILYDIVMLQQGDSSEAKVADSPIHVDTVVHDHYHDDDDTADTTTATTAADTSDVYVATAGDDSIKTDIQSPPNEKASLYTAVHSSNTVDTAVPLATSTATSAGDSDIAAVAASIPRSSVRFVDTSTMHVDANSFESDTTSPRPTAAVVNTTTALNDTTAVSSSAGSTAVAGSSSSGRPVVSFRQTSSEDVRRLSGAQQHTAIDDAVMANANFKISYGESLQVKVERLRKVNINIHIC
jgi:hypothetical protein